MARNINQCEICGCQVTLNNSVWLLDPDIIVCLKCRLRQKLQQHIDTLETEKSTRWQHTSKRISERKERQK